MSTLLKISEVIDGSKPYVSICEPCIYFLISDDQVVYVGQSTSVYARLQVHKNNPKKIWDRFFIVPTHISKLDEIELKYYLEFKPKYNTTAPTSAARDKRLKKESKIENAEIFDEDDRIERQRVSESLAKLLGRTKQSPRS